MIATVGQVVWFLDLDDQRGPFPALVVRSGERPLLAVLQPEQDTRAECSHWLTEDGSTTGWFAIPVSGAVPADLFL